MLDFLGLMRLMPRRWKCGAGQTAALSAARASRTFTLVAPAHFRGRQPQMLDGGARFVRRTREGSAHEPCSLGTDEGRMIGNVLVIGSRAATPREFRPVERPELAAAFEAAGDTAAQVILIPPADTQRVVEELMPQLPKELGGGPSSVLTRGIRWAAVGIDVSAAQGAAAGDQVGRRPGRRGAARASWPIVLRLAGQQPEVRRHVPEFDEPSPPC